MIIFFAASLVGVLLQAQPGSQAQPATMTKINVHLTGPGIKPGSEAAMPKIIFRAGSKYARIEDAPSARATIEKITIIAEPDAYSINLIDHTGTHAIDQGGSNDLHLPMVLPFDPVHRLGDLDRLEFGGELEFFQQEGATKSSGPIINARPTDRYALSLAGSHAELITRANSAVAIFVSWSNPDGTYKYEYNVYRELPFNPQIFSPPHGIKFREIQPPAPGESGE